MKESCANKIGLQGKFNMSSSKNIFSFILLGTIIICSATVWSQARIRRDQNSLTPEIMLLKFTKALSVEIDKYAQTRKFDRKGLGNLMSVLPIKKLVTNKNIIFVLSTSDSSDGIDPLTDPDISIDIPIENHRIDTLATRLDELERLLNISNTSNKQILKLLEKIVEVLDSLKPNQITLPPASEPKNLEFENKLELLKRNYEKEIERLKTQIGNLQDPFYLTISFAYHVFNFKSSIWNVRFDMLPYEIISTEAFNKYAIHLDYWFNERFSLQSDLAFIPQQTQSTMLSNRRYELSIKGTTFDIGSIFTVTSLPRKQGSIDLNIGIGASVQTYKVQGIIGQTGVAKQNETFIDPFIIAELHFRAGKFCFFENANLLVNGNGLEGFFLKTGVGILFQ